MENKISIEKVIDSIQLENGSTFGSYISKNGNIYEIIEKAMMKFGQQLLELAAENAKLSIYRENMHVSSDNESLIDNEYSHGEYDSNGPDYHVNIQINEKSILDTIKQVE